MTDREIAGLVRRAVGRFGAARVARIMGMSREAILAVASCSRARVGTWALAAERVDRLAALGVAPPRGHVNFPDGGVS